MLNLSLFYFLLLITFLNIYNIFCILQCHFKFRKGQEQKIYNSWRCRAAKRLRQMFGDIRKKGAPTDWIPDDILVRLREHWATEDYKKIQETNRANRASSTGDSVHTGGSTTYTAKAKKMVHKLFKFTVH